MQTTTKNFLFIAILLIALALIIMVILFFDNKIKRIEKESKGAVTYALNEIDHKTKTIENENIVHQIHR